jgi:heat shock protein HslJ
LVTISGHPPVKGSHITISFDKGRVSGNSGCNNYGGEYQVRGDRIEIGELETTLMGCVDQAIMDQEAMFTRFLAEAERFDIAAGKLQLYAAGGESLYLLPAQASYSYP